MRKITRKGIIRKLDKLVSQVVIARDKKCGIIWRWIKNGIIVLGFTKVANVELVECQSQTKTSLDFAGNITAREQKKLNEKYPWPIAEKVMVYGKATMSALKVFISGLRDINLNLTFVRDVESKNQSTSQILAKITRETLTILNGFVGVVTCEEMVGLTT